MTLKAKIFLAVAGVLLIGLSFVLLTGWLKYAPMFVGSVMLQFLWQTYAGTPAPQQDEPHPHLRFDESDYFDWSRNCDWPSMDIGIGAGRDDSYNI